MRRLARVGVVLVACSLPGVARAWHDEGHVYAARAAVEALPESVPAFFREGRDTVAHCSLDPDVIRSRQLPQLRATDAPEHFIDSEYLEGIELPDNRFDYYKACYDAGLDPGKVGMLPYAIADWAQRLTMAFAEHRRWPDNPHIRMKCLVIAGTLSHYTADLHMPLHTTAHFDGKVPIERTLEGKVIMARNPRTQIHEKVDALPTKVPYAEVFAEPVSPEERDGPLWPMVLEELKRSHAHVDRVYELEPKIPAMADLSLTDDEVRAFTIDRQRAAATFTATIFLKAWRDSETLKVPEWLDRSVFDETFDPTKVPPQPAP